MKLDTDLIRDILLRIDEASDPSDKQDLPVEPNKNPAFQDHWDFLESANLITPGYSSSENRLTDTEGRITPAGRSLLKALREIASPKSVPEVPTDEKHTIPPDDESRRKTSDTQSAAATAPVEDNDWQEIQFYLEKWKHHEDLLHRRNATFWAINAAVVGLIAISGQPPQLLLVGVLLIILSLVGLTVFVPAIHADLQCRNGFNPKLVKLLERRGVLPKSDFEHDNSEQEETTKERREEWSASKYTHAINLWHYTEELKAVSRKTTSVRMLQSIGCFSILELVLGVHILMWLGVATGIAQPIINSKTIFFIVGSSLLYTICLCYVIARIQSIEKGAKKVRKVVCGVLGIAIPSLGILFVCLLIAKAPISITTLFNEFQARLLDLLVQLVDHITYPGGDKPLF